MTYSRLYPNAEPFEEPQLLLFRVLDPVPCLFCDVPAPWLTYHFAGHPIGVCSGECMEALQAVARSEG